jgi:1,4-dihydroxy-2-naphthoate octaprenyltransferase
MNPVSLQQLILFLRLSQPLFLLGGILLYGLGVAIAHYLGRPIDTMTYILGQAIVILIQLMAQYLNAYFNATYINNNEEPSGLMSGNRILGQDGLSRKVALYAAAFSLTLTASTILLLISTTEVPLLAWLILGIILMGAFIYNLPPINLKTSGYGEISASFIIAGLLPTFAYSLQTGEIHRFLIMSGTPLIALHFAMMIAFELPNFASDTKFNRRNLLIRVNWPTAMRMHDLAILFAVISFIVAYFLGLPLRVALGSLIALPLALGQLWQMDRIRQGFPTRWRALTSIALALFALTAYLQLIGFLLS